MHTAELWSETKMTDLTSDGTRSHQAQAFGAGPLQVRDTDHYTDEYVKGFVEKWDELIDWKSGTRAREVSSSTCSSCGV